MPCALFFVISLCTKYMYTHEKQENHGGFSGFYILRDHEYFNEKVMVRTAV